MNYCRASQLLYSFHFEYLNLQDFYDIIEVDWEKKHIQIYTRSLFNRDFLYYLQGFSSSLEIVFYLVSG